jgi:hypothetical protein
MKMIPNPWRGRPVVPMYWPRGDSGSRLEAAHVVEVTGIGPSTSACISPAASLARGFLALMGGRGRPNLTPRSWARFRPSPGAGT